jgi:hypothetical protein
MDDDLEGPIEESVDGLTGTDNSERTGLPERGGPETSDPFEDLKDPGEAVKE